MCPTHSANIVSHSGSWLLGGDLAVHRFGFGTNQLAGPDVWGEPRDPGEAIRVIRRAVDLGVNLIDTADSYGPYVSERLIRKALFPYHSDATKIGLTRPAPRQWIPNGHPAYLKGQVELSLANLGVECIDLLQLHRVDPAVPLEDQVGALRDMQTEGKVRHIGLSQVSIEQVVAASSVAEIVSVQNRFNLVDRSADLLVDYAQATGIAFIPWFPLGKGKLAGHSTRVSKVAIRLGLSSAQLALAWLLRRSTTMLPIPGTSRIDHLDENVNSVLVELSDDEFDEVSRIAH